MEKTGNNKVSISAESIFKLTEPKLVELIEEFPYIKYKHFSQIKKMMYNRAMFDELVLGNTRIPKYSEDYGVWASEVISIKSGGKLLDAYLVLTTDNKEFNVVQHANGKFTLIHKEIYSSNTSIYEKKQSIQEKLSAIVIEVSKLYPLLPEINNMIDKKIDEAQKKFEKVHLDAKDAYENGLLFNNQYMPKQGAQSILVLGNGFDLNCGLKSRYNDFFKWSYEYVDGFKNIVSDFKNRIKLHNDENNEYKLPSMISIWDLYFLTTSLDPINEVYWCNVENEIKNSFDISFWEDVYNLLNRKIEVHKIKDLIREKVAILYYLVPLLGYRHNGKYDSINDFFKLLLSELNILEDRFSQYLHKEVDENVEFKTNQVKLIEKLIKHTSNNENFQIISFNYTGIPNRMKSTNIHGTLQSPIFGISYISSRRYGEYLYRFTKSDRRMNQGLPILDDIISTTKNNIIFYGVSFSDLDVDHYSNILKLYNGYEKVYFCYSNYDGKDMSDEFRASVVRISEKILSGNFYQNFERKKAEIVLIGND